MANEFTPAYSAITYFHKQYHKRVGPTIFNKYRLKWGFAEMIDQLGYDQTIEVVDYFFAGKRSSYLPTDLLNSYDRLAEALEVSQRDNDIRQNLRASSRERVKKWEERFGTDSR